MRRLFRDERLLDGMQIVRVGQAVERPETLKGLLPAREISSGKADKVMMPQGSILEKKSL